MKSVKHVLPLVVAALASAAWFGAPVLADQAHDGVVVSASAGKLTTSDKDGKHEHTQAVADNATITCDGKACKLTDLKKGYEVKVTMGKHDGKDMVVKIEAKKKS